MAWGVVWGAGASEVFAAQAARDDVGVCVFYCKLPAWQALLSMTTPLVLVSMFVLEAVAHPRSVFYGDYLYFRQGDVP